MSNTENNQEIENNRREELRVKADLLGITYSPNIGNDTLADKIKEHTEAVEKAASFQTDEGKAKAATDMARIPLKVRVSNLDAEEREHTTVYRCVMNTYFTIAHVIPLDTEWFVPKCLCDSLDNAMMQVHVKEIDPITNRATGNMVPKQVKKYNVQYL